MQFDQLKKDIKDVGFDKVRRDTDNYFEAVVTKENLIELISRLDKAFGSLVWPSKNKLSARIQATIKDFGGIKDGQTLYFADRDGYPVFAMLWPWQDGEHITLKISKK